MGMEDLQNNLLFIKLIQKLAYRLGLAYQEEAPEMTADEIYEDQEFFPAFNSEKHNYLKKKIGYVCRSPRGNMVRLIQNYDNSIYPDDPEDLPAQWGFYWPKNPKYAKEFVKLATSPYGIGDCCIENGITYRSKISANVHAPSEYPDGWEEVAVDATV